MKPKFKARELWLFAPFLLIFAGALYWARVEQVSGPNARGMYVSDFKVEAAPGYYQEKGYSHSVKVVISHPWPRPKWWGQMTPMQMGLDPLRPVPALNPIMGYGEKDYLRAGGTLTIERNDKSLSWPANKTSYPNKAGFENGSYVFVHYVDAFSAPKQEGTIGFRGLYKIGIQPAFAVKRIFRNAGETLALDLDKSPGGRLVSVSALPFYESSSYTKGKPPIVSDNCDIYFLVRGTSASEKEDGTPTVQIDDLLVRDEKGKLYRDYAPKGFNFGYGGSMPREKFQLNPDETLTFIGVSIEQATPTSGELTLSGKISLDNHWPIPFKVKLPPRALSGRENVELPRWKRPTNIAPIR